MKVYGIIPARLQSTRLPGKMLLAETGKPLVQYVWEAAKQSTELADVLIATDSPEIFAACSQFGARCELTGEHPSGTDRIAETARRYCADGDIFVNIQGDEPELEPENISAVVRALHKYPRAEMATLATPVRSWEQVVATSCVKVVCAADGQALYFSRAPIPLVRDGVPADLFKDGGAPWLLHVGIYAFRSSFLQELTRRPPSRLEQLEKLEQLRALEAGATIQVAVVDHQSVGIDTPDDYARFVARQRSRVGG